MIDTSETSPRLPGRPTRTLYHYQLFAFKLRRAVANLVLVLVPTTNAAPALLDLTRDLQLR